MEYLICRASGEPPLDGNWSDPVWGQAGTLAVNHFHARSSAHRPVTEARLLYTASGLFVFFRVQDRYVRAVAAAYQDPVCLDSCVEFFVQPRGAGGYFNFEINCGGVGLLYFIRDCDRSGGAFADYDKVDPALFRTVRIFHSMPERVPEEIGDPVEWRIAYFVPFSLFEHYVGPLGALNGQTWRANFYKCADATSHPHWAAWSPIGEALNFHQPRCFAPIRFQD